MQLGSLLEVCSCSGHATQWGWVFGLVGWARARELLYTGGYDLG
jgi:hypothetical protein